MASGYVRQAAANISAGLAIKSADINAEFNQLQATFDNTTGHDHTGSTAGDGAKIPLTSAVNGILPVANGGTGSGTIYQPCPNILYNAAMEIDQTAEGASVSLVSNTPTNTLDGWTAEFISGTAAVSVQRVADAPTGLTNSLKLTTVTGAAVGAGDQLRVFQKIEANNITNMALGTAGAVAVALSFWVKSSIASYTMCGSLENAAGTRSYPFNVSITNSATWEQKTVLLTADTAGAWVTTGTAAGLVLNLTAACGSTFQGTVNTWAAGNFIGTSSITNTLLSTNGATFQITGIKLEISPVVTPYVRRPFAIELIECQRYLEKSYDLGTAIATATTTGAQIIYEQAAVSALGIDVRFKVSKRAAASITVYSPNSGTSGKAYETNSSSDVAASGLFIGQNGFLLNVGSMSGAIGTTVRAHWTADARL